MKKSRFLFAAAALMISPASPLQAAPVPHDRVVEIPEIKKAVRVVNPVSLPDGIAGTEDNLAYLMNPTGSIDAVELATGKLRWTTKDASTPLLAFKGRLVAQIAVADKANALRILGFDAASGKVLLTSEPLIFPDWVQATGTTWGHNFASSSTLEGDELIFKWQASTHYAGGAAPPPEVEEAARRNANGVFRVNLKTGKVQIVEAAPQVEAEGGEIQAQTQRPVLKAPAWNEELSVGDVTALLSLEYNADDKINTLLLKRWEREGRKALPDTSLYTVSVVLPQLSLDGNYVLVHQPAYEELSVEERKWSIFSLATGKQIAKLTFDEMTGAVSIIGARAFCEIHEDRRMAKGGNHPTKRDLKVLDLTSGKELWTRPLLTIQPRMMPM